MQRLHVALLCLLQLIGLLFFARGFFPRQKAAIPGHAQSHSLDVLAVFDRLIFIVVDALRADFAFGPDSSMHSLHEKILKGQALAFTARASTPTVTLPRLKCLTTGSVSGFLDAIFNLAESDGSSAETMPDSWVYQQVAQGRRLHMYGDDTWLRLFPDAFVESEGTTSFFVSDFKQVDNNVTRHIEPVLAKGQWDTVILHYLGLDHIGHLYGPGATEMPIKQMEMAEIIDQIHGFVQDQDELMNRSTAIVVVGDHGMTADGNHGGASEAETQTAAFLISNKLEGLSLGQTWPAQQYGQYAFYRQIVQSDLVPMLSLLTGTPIPINAIGKIPHAALILWNSKAQRLSALKQNARQLQRLLLAAGSTERTKTSLPCSTTASNGVCPLTQINFDSTDSAMTEQNLLTVLDEIQAILMSSSNDFNLLDMALGLVFLAIAAISALVYYVCRFRGAFERSLLAIPICHAATTFATSFVEEEQVFWYYITAAALLATQVSGLARQTEVTVKSVLKAAVPVLMFRLLRRFNQTGQKHADMDDLSGWLTDQPVIFDRVLLATFLAAFLLLARQGRAPMIWAPFWAAFASIALFKYATHTDNAVLLAHPLAQPGLAWTMILIGTLSVMAMGGKKSRMSLLRTLAVLVFCLQARISNLPILLLLLGIARGLRDESGTTKSITLERGTLVTLCALQQATFFAMGNSNALSGLDLSQAYNGVGSYNAVLVGLLLFISSFLGALFWQAEILVWIRQGESSDGLADRAIFARAYLAVSSSAYAFALCLSCYILRHHLFIYSVFSPKVLYEVAWSLFYTIVMVSI